ncbi:MAG: tyrosine-type recombinase/integrase [Pirellulaceae bacterium]
MPLLEGSFPSRGLRYPKADDKPPFQTRDEILRQTEAQSLSKAAAQELWECLYLRKQEVEQLLDTVSERTWLPPYAYPMICTAAHTGARRSELLRAEVGDLDVENLVLTLREKKRVRGRRSTRRVPLSSRLAECLSQWLEFRSSGPNLFNDAAGQTLTPDKVQGTFRNAVCKSTWDVVRGWHTLRHSFISNLACDGIDQRIIDDFVGHTTEEMRRRYRHLFPNVKSSAIARVFG